MNSLTFIKKLYDHEGDVFDENIFLCLNDVTIIKIGSLEDLKSFHKQVERIIKELEDNY
jgi:hypothetical protein